MYNKRLKITESDYTRLESLLMEFLNSKDSQVVSYLDSYFQRAKNDHYTITRILFDIHAVLTQWLGLHIDSRSGDYDFLRKDLNYLKDDNLESALKVILTPVIEKVKARLFSLSGEILQ